jgi:hypothetical protein
VLLPASFRVWSPVPFWLTTSVIGLVPVPVAVSVIRARTPSPPKGCAANVAAEAV